MMLIRRNILAYINDVQFTHEIPEIIHKREEKKKQNTKNERFHFSTKKKIHPIFPLNLKFQFFILHKIQPDPT